MSAFGSMLYTAAAYVYVRRWYVRRAFTSTWEVRVRRRPFQPGQDHGRCFWTGRFSHLRQEVAPKDANRRRPFFSGLFTGQQVFDISRSGRVGRFSNSHGSGWVTLIGPDPIRPTRPDPTRPDPRGMTRLVNKPVFFCASRSLVASIY